MAQICEFRCDEPVRLDPERVVALYAELGQTGAERVISAAMEDLAVHLTTIQGALDKGDLPLLTLAVAHLERLACQVGLYRLAGVAQDLLRVGARGDGVAAAAVLARLVRIGDRSLTAVWDSQDMRG